MLSNAERLSFLTKEGQYFVNEAGDRVILRGVNTGNWLLLEMWMQALSDGSIPDQHSLEEVLTSRFGEAEKDRLMEIWRENFITERDFELLAEYDFNVIRLPFWHRLLETDDEPFVLKPNAFRWLDQAIEWAGERGIYVILDLHGAQGSQGWEHHSGQEGRNELWSDEQNQRRVEWMWQQVAARYRNHPTVAAYDILNEPWGTTEEQLESVVVRIAEEIREVDPHHVIFLPGDISGIWFYDEPVANYGLDNIAFTHHFYPGLFGGTPNIETHQNYFQGTGNEYIGQMNRLNSPFLVGEMNVVFNSAGGGEMMRHHYDFYAAQGWATTGWSWKVFTNGGGLSGGTWGFTTNPKSGAMVVGNTWECDNWNGSFADAACYSESQFTVPRGEAETYHLVIKAGAQGIVDVSLDNISLRDSTGVEVLTNGGFDGGVGWTEFTVNGEQTIGFNDSALPAGGIGTALRISSLGQSNGGVYQAIELIPGETYQLSGLFRDVGSPPQSAWCEVYISREAPQDGVDYLNSSLIGNLNYQSASIEEIEEYFRSFSSMDILVNEPYREWLGEEERSPEILEGWPPAWRLAQAADPLPEPWRAYDVGASNRGGQRVYSETELALYGAGEDIWQESDQFRFVYQPVNPEFQITAQLQDLRDTDQFAKGGLMARAGLADDAPHISIQALPSGLIESNSRPAPGSGTDSFSGETLTFPNIWLRLQGGQDGVVRALYSQDGDQWTELNSLDLSEFTGKPYAGLLALSHDNSLYTRAHFSNLFVEGATGTPPLEEQKRWTHWFQDGPVRTDFEVASPASSISGNAMRISAKPGTSGGVYTPIKINRPEASFSVLTIIQAAGSESGVLRFWLSDAPPVDGSAPDGAEIFSGFPTGAEPGDYYLVIDFQNSGPEQASAVIDELILLNNDFDFEGWMSF